MRSLFLALMLLFSGCLIANAQQVVQTKTNAPITRSTVKKSKPSFKGGRPALLRFIDVNLEYPPLAKEQKVEGVLVVQLKIDETGKIVESKVVEPMRYGCDEAALEMVRKMPDWEPAIRSGKPVTTLYNLPIQFRLH